jgi:hypothetical protein
MLPAQEAPIPLPPESPELPRWWKRVPGRIRRITARREELAVTLTKENGKPLALARAEVDSMAEQSVWFAEEAQRIMGRIISPEAPTRRILTLRQPVDAGRPFPAHGGLIIAGTSSWRTEQLASGRTRDNGTPDLHMMKGRDSR